MQQTLCEFEFRSARNPIGPSTTARVNAGAVLASHFLRLSNQGEIVMPQLAQSTYPNRTGKHGLSFSQDIRDCDYHQELNYSRRSFLLVNDETGYKPVTSHIMIGVDAWTGVKPVYKPFLTGIARVRFAFLSR